jgi:hypothetical protein
VVHRGPSSAIACGLALLLASCQGDPAACETFEIEDGSRPSRLPTSFERPTRRFVWAQCSDRKTRMLQCRTANTSKYKCECQVHDDDSERYSLGSARTDEALPADRAGATAFANGLCSEFRLAPEPPGE